MRIKDARIGATKMVLMHVVTGQEFKNPMVLETIGLARTLYEATEIKFNIKPKKEGEEEEGEEEKEGEEGNSKYTKLLEDNNKINKTNSTKYPLILKGGNKYNLNFDFIEIVE